MTKSMLSDRLDAGGVAWGAWTVLGSPFVAELCLDGGFDFICVDLQHGIAGRESLANTLIACNGYASTPIVRVGEKSESDIGLALDLGAHGVIIPMVNTPADAESAVRAVKYAPLGERSFGPTRSRLQLNRDRTLAEVNREVLCLVMIETLEGVANVSEICAVEGVDGVYAGPSDLAVNLQETPGQEDLSPPLRRALEIIRTACSSRGILAGVHAGTSALARQFRDEGFQMISIASDAVVLRTAYANELAAARGCTK